MNKPTFLTTEQINPTPKIPKRLTDRITLYLWVAWKIRPRIRIHFPYKRRRIYWRIGLFRLKNKNHKD